MTTHRSDSGKDMDRRTWLKQVGAATGTILIPGLTACGDGELGAEPAAGEGAALPDAGGADVALGPFPGLEPLRGDGSHPFHYIDTVVIVEMENRSFDHYFGSLSLVEGRVDVDGLQAGMTNSALNGAQVPLMHLTDDYVISPDPGHGHRSCLVQFNDGSNDGFIRDWETRLASPERGEKLGWPLGYYQRDQLPAYYALADQFTLCDRWFCSLLGPTWPNRYYSHAATSDGVWSNGTPLESPTAYRLVMDAGLRFGVYHQSVIFSMLTVNNPRATEYPRGFIDNFYADAAAGELPNVSFVEPDYTFNDDHPPQDIRFGQAFVAGIYEALRQSPQWDRCLMLVLYDEHGGFFDHVPPPTVEGESRAEQGFDQLGFRIPGLLIGPLVKRHHIFHDVVDHASVPSLLSKIFELDHVNERSRLAGDFSGAFDLELTLDANRPAPQGLPTVDLSFEKIRRAFDEPFGQPEMEDYARRVWGIERESKSREIGRAERLLRALEALRVVRVGS